MQFKITSIDANKALLNPILLKSFRRLTYYSTSGMNIELNSLAKIVKERKVKAKMVMAHVNNVMVGWALLSREPSNFWFCNGSFDKQEAKEYTLLEIYVGQKYRKQGIGTAIVQRAKKLVSITKGQPFAIAPHDEAGLKTFNKINTTNDFLKLDGLYL